MKNSKQLISYLPLNENKNLRLRRMIPEIDKIFEEVIVLFWETFLNNSSFCKAYRTTKELFNYISMIVVARITEIHFRDEEDSKETLKFIEELKKYFKESQYEKVDEFRNKICKRVKSLTT